MIILKKAFLHFCMYLWSPERYKNVLYHQINFMQSCKKTLLNAPQIRVLGSFFSLQSLGQMTAKLQAVKVGDLKKMPLGQS